MTKIDSIKFQKQILQWYRANYRELPWRKTTDPYQIWISEVMLQQTQVATVIPYYERFLAKFPTIQILANADLQDVLKVWEGLGYYSRARNIHKAAKRIVDEYGGQFPADYNAIRGLPGVGDYIAAAVSSISFSQTYAVLDGNVKRVLSRLICSSKAVNDLKSSKYYRNHANRLLDTENPGDHNQAMMELGAVICRPGSPNCAECPVNNFCEAYRQNNVNQFPRKIKKARVPTHQIAIGVIRDGKHLLITQRKEKGLLGGLWEFPGGKVKKGELAAEACVREIQEETGIRVEVDQFLTHVKHAYTHFKIEVDVFVCKCIAGEIKLNGPVDFRWVTSDELEKFPFPKANHKFLPFIIDQLR